MQPELRDLWDFEDPEGSERRFREAARDATEFNDVEPELALTQVARPPGLQGRYGQAEMQLASLGPAGACGRGAHIGLAPPAHICVNLTLAP